MSNVIPRLERLRSATRAAHQRIETVPAMARLMAPDLTRLEYSSVLQHLLAFHATIEPAIATALENSPIALELLDGARPRALAADLEWLGVTNHLPTPQTPSIEDAAAALGALYVVEGSSLGGRVIGRHITESLGLSAGAGGSFYLGLTATAARERWRMVCDLLDLPLNKISRTNHPGSSVDTLTADDAAAAAACETFQYLEQWLRRIQIVAQHRPATAAVVP